jgi:hypothetical protein
MTLKTGHFKEELHHLMDGRLNAKARLELEEHLRLCSECSKELDALEWTKHYSRNAYASVEIPVNLEEKILSALGNEGRIPARRSFYNLQSWFMQGRGLAYGSLFCVAAVLAFAVLIFWPSDGNISEQFAEIGPAAVPIDENAPVMPWQVAEGYQNYKHGRLPLGLRTQDVAEMEKFFIAQGIAFPTRVFDFRMMNYNLEGGRVNDLEGHKIAFYTYLGKNNKILICQMYRGNVSQLPADAELRENNGIRFYVYRLNGLTTVFWQEGRVTCVLTSEVDSREVVDLAFAKAVKV